MDVYRLPLEYIGFMNRFTKRLVGDLRHAKDQWIRASQSITLNIAEGNGKSGAADRNKFFEISGGSAL